MIFFSFGILEVEGDDYELDETLGKVARIDDSLGQSEATFDESLNKVIGKSPIYIDSQIFDNEKE